jgi:hypothetical protein
MKGLNALGCLPFLCRLMAIMAILLIAITLRRMVTGITLDTIQRRMFLVLEGHHPNFTLSELKDFFIWRDHLSCK